jgi:hypothetical protein
MPRKLALKRLTSSDLTLFRWHFREHPAGKQKAFNLDSKVLVADLYPQLGEPAMVPVPRFPLDLYLIGPGLAPAQNLQRKILKQQKNWRLNGELIDGPEEDPDRYSVLRPGDFAIFEFFGNGVPSTAKVVLIAEGVEEDLAMHKELSQRYPEGSMWALDEAGLATIVEAAQPPSGHPLHDWSGTDVIEDAVLGGAAGVAGITRRRGGRGMSPEEFVRSRVAAEQTGVLGEELLNQYFEQQLLDGQLELYEWSSSINAVSPFDFCLNKPAGERRLVDAKSTSGDFKNVLHLSCAELLRAVAGPEPYDIYRLYEVTDTSAKLRIAEDVGGVLAGLLEVVSSLPKGVAVDSFSINPALLPFDGTVHTVVTDAEATILP